MRRKVSEGKVRRRERTGLSEEARIREERKDEEGGRDG